MIVEFGEVQAGVRVLLEPINRSLEQDLIDQIDANEMDSHLDALEGLERISGSDDEWEASKYIVDKLGEYGVTAELNEFEGFVSVPKQGRLTTTVPTRRDVDAITVSFSAATPLTGVHGTVVAVNTVSGEMIQSEALNDDLVLLEGLPNPDDVGRAERAGAAGLIFQSPNDHRYQGIVTPVWGTPSSDTAGDIPDVPVVEVNRTDGEWLRETLAQGPIEATIETEVTTELRSLPCPVGRIEGATSDRYFVVGNHVDSWFTGMTDNATAIAATLEVARIVAEQEKPLARGILFGFWPAHSTGRYAGSAWYADTNWLDLRENGVAYLHIDLPGLHGVESVWYQQMAELEAEHMDAIETATSLSIRKSEESYLGATGRPARNSDQSFWGAGLSSLLSGGRLSPGSEEGGPIGGGWWWHTPHDTRDKVDLDVLMEETKLYLALTARICASPVLPHDFRETVVDFEAALDEIETAADEAISFDEIRSDLDELATKLEAIYAIVEADVSDDPTLGAAVETLQVELGNVLNPALYMRRSEYEHDPREPFEQLPLLRIAEDLPSLTGRDRRFAETTVQRSRVKTRHRIQRATDLAVDFLDAHE